MDLTPSYAGNFTGTSLVVDPKTGFLRERDNPLIPSSVGGTMRLGRSPVFTPAKKIEALKLLDKWFPNLTKVCEKIGITRQTFMNHLQIDEKLRQCYDNIKEKHIDKIESVRFDMAKTKGKFGQLDRMATLNAYRRETYQPNTKIEIQHNMSVSEAQERRSRWAGAIDAEVVDTVRKLRSAERKSERP